MAEETINIVKEECFLDDLLREFPNRVAKPSPAVKGNSVSFSKLFHQISDSLKDIHLQYTCVDVSSLVVALGTNVGNAFIYQRRHKKILKISSETKYIPTTCIKLATGCGIIAFGHETGTFSVGLVEPQIHKSFDSLTAQDIHHSAITCLEWSTDGLILYAGDKRGQISMSVVKISEAILQTAIIITEDAGIVQLSYTVDALLASSTRRTVLWSFQNEQITQVGEKERKTSGPFGGCFLPENLREPSKKLYAARPGQRIWTADESGRVSSTSVYKSLLADKPQTIYTLTGNDKTNSGGQFGVLLSFYKQFVTTWDQNHLWILDMQQGAVVACHGNLGKILDVAVSGHEVFVLVNQRDRFLRRFVLISEKLGPSSLDAVIATRENEAAESLPQKVERVERVERVEDKETGDDVAAATAKVETETAVEENKVDVTDNLFERISSIPLDDGKGDIVFCGVKRKKKKKKIKHPSIPEATRSPTERPETWDPRTLRAHATPVSQSNDETTLGEAMSKNETPSTDIQDTGGPPVFSNTTSHDSNEDATIKSPEFRSQEIHERSKILSQNEAEEFNNTGSDQLTIGQEEKLPNIPAIETLHVSEEVNKTFEHEVSDDHHSKDLPSDNQSNTSAHKTDSDVTIPDKQLVTEETAPSVLECSQTPMMDIPEPESAPVEDSGVLTGSESRFSPSARQESTESGDEHRILNESSDYLRSDSYEPDQQASLDEIGKGSKGLDDRTSDEDGHVPLFADTWSRRPLPTVHSVEGLAISQKCIICVDSRGVVFYSDPSTASCSGWEQVDWKARQVCVDRSGGLISYVERGNKAFVCGNVSDSHPVGNKSFHILDEVASLSTCSECCWAMTTGGGLRKASSSTLLDLKGDVRNPKIWRPEDTMENLCQIACFDNVLWGRTLDDVIAVYAGHSAGRKTTWHKLEDKQAKWLNMSDDGTAWIITPDDQIWFKPGVSPLTPTGEVWYQVTLGEYMIDDASILDSTFNFFQSVGSAYRSSRTTEYLRHAAKGLIQSTKDMACSLFRDGGFPKQIYCNMQGGVWLLDTKNTLHACRGQVTGAYWKRISPTGTAQSSTWKHVTTGLGGYVWALQPNGEMTCFNPEGPSYNVESPSSNASLDFMSSSPHGVWCFATNHSSKIFTRDGISDSYPQGFAWASLTLKHLDIGSVKHVSLGRITAWAVDMSGTVWIRIGDLGGDESVVRSQAWLPVEGLANVEMATVEVNVRDTMVWATDVRGNVYARDGVSDDFLIGSSWREVSGALLKSVCLSSCGVYGLCTSGEIVCRYGVSSTNCIGDYWKKIPGNFVQMSVNSAGELWAIDLNGRLFVRKTKFLFRKAAPSEDKREDAKEEATRVAVADDVDGDSENKESDEEADWELL